MTKTCLQCGAVLQSSVRTCHFCDSSFFTEASSGEERAAPHGREARAPAGQQSAFGAPIAPCAGVLEPDAEPPERDLNAGWRGEVARRMEAYRVRRRKATRNPAQAQFLFEEEAHGVGSAVAIAEPSGRGRDEFAFTLAIGRKEPERDGRMEIDVSIPPKAQQRDAQTAAERGDEGHYGAYPVASLAERRLAALIDLVCLLFAYGGFLALFGSLGGQFTMSKLSAAVIGATLAIVYLQYFALFTIFGGTTPGMMFRGLQVTSFDGDTPQPRQMLLRSVGYILSAGTFFLGFLWACWDEDGLTWHDRFSRTYLSVAETFADEGAEVAHGR